jgi:hypothetical protein
MHESTAENLIKRFVDTLANTFLLMTGISDTSDLYTDVKREQGKFTSITFTLYYINVLFA